MSKKEIKAVQPNNDQATEQISVAFTGTALELFSRYLLFAIASAWIIPAPWATAWFNRWFYRKIRLSDETTLSFSGEGNQIWFPVMASIILSRAVTFVESILYQLLLSFLLLPISIFFTLIITKWFWMNIIPSCDTRISFVGTYPSLLRWNLFISISFLSIIGWAWVLAEYIRWFFKKTKCDGHVVEFHGDGWNILWRTVLWVLSLLLIVPIPWTSLWLLKWFVANVSIRKIIAY